MFRARRIPRFRRAGERMRRLQITERDTEIIRQIAKHRFLRSGHVVSLVGGSKQQTLRRLQLLYHHNYLERPRSQLDYYYRGGSRELVYGLGSRGAAHLRRKLNMPFHRMDWSGKNQSVGRLFLDHALLVSDFMVPLENCCRERADVRLLSRDEILLPDSLRDLRDPFRWNVQAGKNRRLAVVPDSIFALERDIGKSMEQRVFFLEADRGTMPVKRDRQERTSIHRKMLAYEATWRQRVHKSRFGWDRFRVLLVTNSSDRRQNMLSACQTLEGGHGLFLFCTIGELLKSTDVLSCSWTTGDHRRGSTLLS